MPAGQARGGVRAASGVKKLPQHIALRRLLRIPGLKKDVSPLIFFFGGFSGFFGSSTTTAAAWSSRAARRLFGRAGRLIVGAERQPLAVEDRGFARALVFGQADEIWRPPRRRSGDLPPAAAACRGRWCLPSDDDRTQRRQRPRSISISAGRATARAGPSPNWRRRHRRRTRSSAPPRPAGRLRRHRPPWGRPPRPRERACGDGVPGFSGSTSLAAAGSGGAIIDFVAISGVAGEAMATSSLAGSAFPLSDLVVSVFAASPLAASDFAMSVLAASVLEEILGHGRNRRRAWFRGAGCRLDGADLGRSDGRHRRGWRAMSAWGLGCGGW